MRLVLPQPAVDTHWIAWIALYLRAGRGMYGLRRDWDIAVEVLVNMIIERLLLLETHQEWTRIPQIRRRVSGCRI